jgi:hypothetical protein
VIEEDTSLQDACAVRGEVRIGAHCLFGRNSLVISTTHRFRDRPEWLIRDQDRAFRAFSDAQTAKPGTAIRIDDDCWLGWGSVVNAGVNVGRGAIIGANCVVTRDVGPYEIHGGVPNKKVGQRLQFFPPTELDALDDAHLPYFYRGFFHLRAALANTRAYGTIGAKNSACIVLSRRANSWLKIRGVGFAGVDASKLRVTINGVTGAPQTLAHGKFEFRLPIPVETLNQASNVPKAFHDHAFVELEIEGAGCEAIFQSEPLYGIASAEILS